MKPLSFIIITYNRPGDALELMQNIATLDGADELLEEIILLNNKSTSDYSDVQQFIKNQTLPFKYIDAPDNLGVAKGRNYAIKFSTAPILILLDDDAVLQNQDALKQVLNAFNNKIPESELNDRETAIVSFKVLYYDTLQMQENALPHKKFEKYKDLSSFYTYYYAGGAHAVKRHVLEEVNYYPEDFFYGMEEYDVAYRLLDKGYAIQYNSSIVMLHKESPLGRKPNEEKVRMMWVNKSKVAWRYLPKRYFYFTSILWSFHFLQKSGFNLGGFVKGWRAIFRIPKTVTRKTVNKKTLAVLQAVEARLHY